LSTLRPRAETTLGDVDSARALEEYQAAKKAHKAVVSTALGAAAPATRG
jgi:hypothetical protein